MKRGTGQILILALFVAALVSQGLAQSDFRIGVVNSLVVLERSTEGKRIVAQLEEKNKDLVQLAAENTRQQADAKAYAVSAAMNAVEKVDPKVLQALASVGMDSGQLVALAFKELAENADKIGQLNVSPELLNALLSQ